MKVNKLHRLQAETSNGILFDAFEYLFRFSNFPNDAFLSDKLFTQRQALLSATNFYLSDKAFTQRQPYFSATPFEELISGEGGLVTYFHDLVDL